MESSILPLELIFEHRNYLPSMFLFVPVSVGLLKAFLFGIVITTVSCHEGFAATQGALGVGSATRRSVIISFLLILMVGLLVTGLFYY